MTSEISWIFLAFRSNSGSFPFSHSERPVLQTNSSANPSLDAAQTFPTSPVLPLLSGCTHHTHLSGFTVLCKSTETLPKSHLASPPISEPLALTVLVTPLDWARLMASGILSSCLSFVLGTHLSLCYCFQSIPRAQGRLEYICNINRCSLMFAWDKDETSCRPELCTLCLFPGPLGFRSALGRESGEGHREKKPRAN